MFGESLSTGAGVDVSFGVTVALLPAVASTETLTWCVVFWSNKPPGTRNGLESLDVELGVALLC